MHLANIITYFNASSKLKRVDILCLLLYTILKSNLVKL